LKQSNIEQGQSFNFELFPSEVAVAEAWNPWDAPPLPKRGDEDQVVTHAGVGRVLSQWEMIEVRLGHIYAWLMNRPDEIEAVREYGEGKRIFEERIKGLCQIANVYFRWNPHQDTEGELHALICITRRYSRRRNDIAHCVVRPFEWAASPNGRVQFGAFPPLYGGKKFDPQNMPAFIYTSVEMNVLSNALFGVAQNAGKFQWKLMLGEDGVPPELS
jgi:hypothetical protein